MTTRPSQASSPIGPPPPVSTKEAPARPDLQGAERPAGLVGPARPDRRSAPADAVVGGGLEAHGEWAVRGAEPEGGPHRGGEARGPARQRRARRVLPEALEVLARHQPVD